MPAGRTTGALAQSDAHVVLNALEMGFVGNRANLGRDRTWVTKFKGSYGGLQAADKGVMQFFLHQQSGACDAALTIGDKNARYDAAKSLLNIGIGKHDLCRFASKLQGDALEQLASPCGDPSSHRTRAGEADARDQRVADQRVAYFGPEAGDHIQYAGGHPDRFEAAHQGQG